MLVAALSLALLASPQDPPPIAAQDEPVRLEDVEITGRPLEEMVETFVKEISAPARGRGMARWRTGGPNGVCVSVANLRNDLARQLIDRVAMRIDEIGLTPGEPDCRPNVYVIMTTEANAFTRDFIAERPVLFRVGGGGMDRGLLALRKFTETDRPVRSWHVSVPVDRDTRERATRVPGDCSVGSDCRRSFNYAPIIQRDYASNFRTQIVDDMGRVFVIVDIDRLNGANLTQLGDYIAMVTLAQIDEDADVSGYATILNVFDDPQGVAEMTDWDRAFLTGLYRDQRIAAEHAAHIDDISRSITRAHHDLRAAGEN